MQQKTVLGFYAVSSLVAVILSATIAQAGDPVCGTLKECNELTDKIEARVQELLRTTVPNLSDIVKRADGVVLRLDQPDAKKYCKDRGFRLPTARELALYSQSLGARGLRETVYSGVSDSDPAVQAEITQMKKDGYDSISMKNAAGETTVDFYFNYHGYQRPAGDLGNEVFWSSSIHPFSCCYYPYYLVGEGGYILDGVGTDLWNYAFRCVR